MKNNHNFLKTVCKLAIPVAIQSMLQSSFGIIDQIMIGQLGSVSISGVGFAGKFTSIFSVLISAIAAVAGIMISQYMGQKNQKEIRKSFYLNLFITLGISLIFTLGCVAFPKQIMGLYTKDQAVIDEASIYLRIVAGTFLPMAGATMLATMFRCMEKTQFPLIATIASAVLNTGLNFILISKMGTRGAAIATLVSQAVNFLVMFVIIFKYSEYLKADKNQNNTSTKFGCRQYLIILLPILISELLWSLGENVYAGIYGHMGTESSAAMTLINPIQGLMIGALCGLSQAASVIIGKKLGNKEFDEAYTASKKLIYYGLVGSLLLSVIVVLTSPFYIHIYDVENNVKLMTQQILFAYAMVAPFKVLNMIIGGGIIRSGGKTSYVMFIDIVGTWGFGVPLGLISAFVFDLPISWVYFILSIEECIRFGISMVVLKRRKWMQRIGE